MKAIRPLTVMISIIMLTSCAAEFEIMSDDVPMAVSSAFKAKYPDVSNPEWEVEKEDGRLVYEAEFKLQGKKKEAEFIPDGTFIKEE